MVKIVFWNVEVCMLLNEKGQKHSMSDTKRSVRVGYRRMVGWLQGKE
jgi:hypothetical protein